MTEETKIPLPGEDDALKVPEFLKSKGWFDENIDDDFLNFEDPYKPPRYTLCRFGIPFANVGELHVISGKPGHGKTGLMSQLMAAILCGRFGNTLYHIQSERPKPVVLYIPDPATQGYRGCVRAMEEDTKSRMVGEAHRHIPRWYAGYCARL